MTDSSTTEHTVRVRPPAWHGGRRDPETYDGSLVCARCGSGWPVCAETNPKTGERYSHEQTCAKYDFGHNDMDICLECEADFTRDLGGLDALAYNAPHAGGDD